MGSLLFFVHMDFLLIVLIEGTISFSAFCALSFNGVEAMVNVSLSIFDIPILCLLRNELNLLTLEIDCLRLTSLRRAP